jgi:apolipoprotein N-acyltransferase
MRVIETSKPMVYSVNKGYSAFIDHKGVIMSKQSSSGLYMLNQILALTSDSTFLRVFGKVFLMIVLPLKS